MKKTNPYWGDDPKEVAKNLNASSNRVRHRYWGEAEAVFKQEIAQEKTARLAKQTQSPTNKAARAHAIISGHYIPHFKQVPVPIWVKPFWWTEKRLESLASWLQSLALLEILSIISSLGIIVAIVTFVSNQDFRYDQDVFTAWQTITSASGQSGNGGRKEAIEFLVSRPWRFPWFCRGDTEFPSCIVKQPGQSLAGLDVGLDSGKDSKASGTGAFLDRLQVPMANLRRANLQDAHLWKANLQDADLRYANLQNAFLWSANLQDTDLGSANLQNAVLGGANLQDADLGLANLQDADLRYANLQNAHLWKANLQDADLRDANLQDTILVEANLQDADLAEATYTTEKTPIETCSEIFRRSNPNISEQEFKTALDNGIVHPCPTVWEKAVYNNDTRFPDGLHNNAEAIKAVGLLHIDDLSDAELCKYPWYRIENDCPSQ